MYFYIIYIYFNFILFYFFFLSFLYKKNKTVKNENDSNSNLIKHSSSSDISYSSPSFEELVERIDKKVLDTLSRSQNHLPWFLQAQLEVYHDIPTNPVDEGKVYKYKYILFQTKQKKKKNTYKNK